MDANAIKDAARAWLVVDPDPDTRAAVQAMLDADDVATLAEHFSTTLDFGTGGMRGTMGPGSARMNRRIVQWVSAALAEAVLAHVPDAATRGVVVGGDARRQSDVFVTDVARVLTARGIVVHLAPGPVPTPVVGFATTELGAAAGVIVTASHNPPDDNGYKVFWARGAQIVPPIDTGIQAWMAANPGPVDASGTEGKDLVRPWPPELLDTYFARVAALRVHRGRSARVVYTPVHGVGGAFVRRAMAEAGHELHVVPEQAEPDAAFPTVTFPNPEEPGVLDLAKALATSQDADVIIANDPDADRCAVAVPTPSGWRQLSGNQLGVLLVDDLLSSQEVSDADLVATTIVSTAMTARIAAAYGVAYAEALTGFKWIAELALAHEDRGGRFLFGFEESIGYTAGDVVRDKDGVSTAVLVADLVASLAARGTTLLERLEHLSREHGLHVGRQVSLRLPGLEGRARIDAAMAALRADPPATIGGRGVLAVRDLAAQEGRRADGSTFAIELPASDVVAFDLDGGSRVLVRPSGTEPKIKVYLEVVVDLEDADSVSDGEARAVGQLDRLQSEVLHAAGLAD